MEKEHYQAGVISLFVTLVFSFSVYGLSQNILQTGTFSPVTVVYIVLITVFGGALFYIAMRVRAHLADVFEDLEIKRTRTARKKAEALKQQRRAEIYVVNENGQTLVNDLRQDTRWINTTLNPTATFSGADTPREPTVQESKRWAFWNYMQQDEKSVSKQPLEQFCEPDTPPATQPLFPEIKDSQTLFLHGPQGTGKTTLLSHLIDYRSQNGDCIVIDPDGYNGQYGPHPITGIAGNYAEIDQTFLRLMDTVQERYEIRSVNGFDDFRPINVFIDELTLLFEYCNDLPKFMRVAFTKFRKAKVRIILCTHSDDVETIGLKKKNSMKIGADFVALKKVNGERWAELKRGGEKKAVPIRLALPGPHPYTGVPSCVSQGVSRHSDTLKNSMTHPISDTLTHRHTASEGQLIEYDACDDYEEDIEPTHRKILECDDYEEDIEPTHRKILDMKAQGCSMNKIAMACFGSRGGRQNKIIKNVLRMYA